MYCSLKKGDYESNKFPIGVYRTRILHAIQCRQRCSARIQSNIFTWNAVTVRFGCLLIAHPSGTLFLTDISFLFAWDWGVIFKFRKVIFPRFTNWLEFRGNKIIESIYDWSRCYVALNTILAYWPSHWPDFSIDCVLRRFSTIFLWPN